MINHPLHPNGNGTHNSPHITLTTGPVWQNPDTQNIVVNVLNVSDKPQTVTVSVIDHSDCTNPNPELGKVAFLCGQPVAPDGMQLTNQPVAEDDGCDCLADPSCCNPNPVFTPITFTIPPKATLAVYAIPNPFRPPVPIFEARVTGAFTPAIFPPSPCRISLFGINAAGFPQLGNIFYHSNFVVYPPVPV
ncbi:hypothetical protein [Neobacillus cucumis]|uniref:hypothetical protein n=1 Tax=Neobacillus cucumis TaxID=1740721 RepID=UPI0019665E9E|nr:hypothetical protein [Neobacillus cucumis]MBM7656549.1 hypothetical protein [Neobacillus cucumis]